MTLSSNDNALSGTVANNGGGSETGGSLRERIYIYIYIYIYMEKERGQFSICNQFTRYQTSLRIHPVRFLLGSCSRRCYPFHRLWQLPGGCLLQCVGTNCEGEITVIPKT